MNFEPEIIPEDMKAAPARSPTVPFHNTGSDFHPSAQSWAPSQVDKPKNVLRPSGGYGKHRNSIIFEEAPIMGGAVKTGSIPKSLLAPHQGKSKYSDPHLIA